MISFLRHFVVDSWVGRILAFVIFLAFVGWGVGDVITNMADDPATVATVGAQKVSTRDFAAALQREMPAMAQQMGAPDVAHIPAILRQQMGREVLQRLIGQAEVLEAAKTYGIDVSDEAVRDEVFSMSYFKGKDGNFDRQKLNAILSANGMTEKRFLGLVHDDIAGRAILEPLAMGVHTPDFVVRRTYAHETETRVIDLLRVPFAEQADPGTPDDATLRRYYANHPWLFQSPEYRHARIVVLSPDTVAKMVPASDEELHRLYDSQRERFHQPELRSVEVVTASDEMAANAIATLWKGGADWKQVQVAAKDAAAVAFDDARPSSFPSDALRKAVFDAAPDVVSGPVKTEMGVAVFRVTKVTPPREISFEAAQPTLRDEITQVRGPSMVSANVPKLQDALAGAGLESIPTDLGAAAAAGFLDAQGMTKEGEPAPLPATGELRDAIVKRVFAQDKGAPPQLMEAKGPGPKGQPPVSLGWYAVSVDEITPAQPMSFETAHGKVLAAWQNEMRHQAANQHATQFYVAAQNKGGLAAVVPEGAPLQKGLMVSRARPLDALPRDLGAVVMHMPVGRSVMGEDDKGFVVLTVTAIEHPDPKSDSLGMARVRDGLSESMASDVTSAYIHGLGKRFKVKILPGGVKAAMQDAGYGDDS
ncbi:peptidyl-prolyl cis-trans isomerase [Acetobacter estunensis NRIC 0472]|uniref:Parvulin-like PPIase n=1 Tax=Acetobacter estunensis TaxID=104097 RepID=A0A967B555_9PROT|nr:peptidylprolyl isomerase [Acetobacter estunensis]NHO53068.1 peptidylprolyl isomerase [Acetobacter estunensis]GBQ29837.1 peptidyl-prolyl cis-trans isomerase [Acetobacter estunensis NRIC 0472]